MNIAMANIEMEKITGDVFIKIDNGGEQNFKSGSPDEMESGVKEELKAVNNRKRLIIWLIIIMAAVCLALTYLFLYNSALKELSIENHDWQFVLFQDDSGNITICSDENSELYPDAEVGEFDIKTGGGRILLSRDAGGKSWEIFYKLSNQNAQGAVYELFFENKKGYAGTGVTKFHDGREEFTLYISLNGYSVKFTEKTA